MAKIRFETFRKELLAKLLTIIGSVMFLTGLKEYLPQDWTGLILMVIGTIVLGLTIIALR